MGNARCRLHAHHQAGEALLRGIPHARRPHSRKPADLCCIFISYLRRSGDLDRASSIITRGVDWHSAVGSIAYATDTNSFSHVWGTSPLGATRPAAKKSFFHPPMRQGPRGRHQGRPMYCTVVCVFARQHASRWRGGRAAGKATPAFTRVMLQAIVAVLV